MSPKQIAWVVPFPLKGSGGHRTIFQKIDALCRAGYKCTVFLEKEAGFKQINSVKQAKKTIDEYYLPCAADIRLGWCLEGHFDAVFATAWSTAKIVRDYQNTKKKAYFIQDFEAYFNPMGDGYLLAENTYRFGLQPITIGRWLAHKMYEEYHMPARYFDFCANLSIYKDRKQKREPLSVCMIYQPEKPRRGPVLGIEALGIVKHRLPDAKIYLYGSEQSGNIWFPHTNLKLLSPKECADLYNRCAVGLCISSSNPSRIPFEMMACGMPVVDLYRENNLYDMPDDSVLLAEQTPESIAEALISILQNPQQYKAMSEAGQKFMAHRDLKKGDREFIEATASLLNNTISPVQKYEKAYKKGPFISQVVMQTSLPQYVHLMKRPLIKRVLRFFIRGRMLIAVKRFIQWAKQ